ncbi:unnamed protein product [Amoebophrya sp. A120]|nr:unnamed protein product [Amoebophrya sp. A120]|eukprot:GSA120T00013097001.1
MAFGRKWADIQDDEPAHPVPQTRSRWADVEEEDDFVGGAPQRFRPAGTGADDKGIRTEVEYTERNGKAVKLITTYQQKKVIKKSNKFVDERKKWKPFGPCTDPAKFADYGGNKPVRAEEEVQIEMNKEKQMKALGQDEKFWEQSVVLCETILNDAKRKRYDANEMRRKREQEFQAQQAEQKAAGIIATGGQNSTLANKYVPPSLRKGDGPQQDARNENTLRVSNLSEDTREGDLQQLFGRVGHVTRVFMPRHKEGEKEGMHKGFAFVQFRDRKDGERAIKQLNGHGYDSLILQVGWAQPKAN